MENGQQYLRTCKLIVFGSDNQGIDLSELRIKFVVRRSDNATPNNADIRVYNLEKQTALDIFMKYNPTGLQRSRGSILLQAGYESNFGVIFQGNIKQVILGRESATDTFIDLIVGDGDLAYNFSIVNTTLSKGASSIDQLNAAATSMLSKGVTTGHIGDLSQVKLPRGKVLYGNARKYLKEIANTNEKTWSIQDEKITFVPLKSYLPSEAVVLTSKTGLIGTPQQTNVGVNVKCLLNPRIQVGGRIDISEASVSEFKIDLNSPNAAANIAPPLNADGIYYVMVVEHQGDTRGLEWYSTLICINTDVTIIGAKTVQVGY